MREPVVSYLFTNGMVMTVDQNGEQMAEYQGEYGRVVNKILDRTGGDRDWILAQWAPGGEIKHLAFFRPVRV